MHNRTVGRLQHRHSYNLNNDRGERNTWRVIILTFVVMIIEIVAGLAFGSMALLADGFHMGTHVFALGITVFAYVYARRHAENRRFSFGTGKVSDLGGFTSAIVLGIVALLMAVESVQRILEPNAIQFNEAITVAVLGLVVNVASALLLQNHDHHHGHDHGDRCHQDHNLRAAYFHVLADALTSVLAIVALIVAKYWGLVWLDPIMGIVGSIVIVRWSYGLLVDTSNILLDGSVEGVFVTKVRAAIEDDADNRVSDLHVWQVGSGKLAAIVTLVTHEPQPPDHYRELLADFDLAHVTVEVNRCEDACWNR